MGQVKNSWKQYILERNIIDCCTAMTRLLSNRVITLGLLQLILPSGWRISKIDENKLKWIERDLQCSASDLYNVYTSTRNNKVKVYNYFDADFNKDFQTVRLNITIDELERIKLIS